MASQFATVDQFKLRYDERLLARLGNDDNMDSVVDATNEILTAALEDASGEIVSATLNGRRYTIAQLEALSISEDGNLVRLTCDLAVYFALTRRASGIPEALADRMKKAIGDLQDLRDGQTIFPTGDADDAGLPMANVINASRRARLGMVSDQPYFPGRRTTEVS